MAPTPSPNDPPRSGRIQARNMHAKNVVTGVQVQGADAETAREFLTLARRIESGSIEAVQDIIATNVVTGLQYLGQGGGELSRADFQQELAALRDQLAQAIAAGEVDNAYAAADAQTAVGRAIEQAQAPAPVAEQITTQLERATTFITRFASLAEAAGKVQAAVIKLVPIAAALKRLASVLF